LTPEGVVTRLRYFFAAHQLFFDDGLRGAVVRGVDARGGGRRRARRFNSTHYDAQATTVNTPVTEPIA
jgi:hypothetical protein